MSIYATLLETRNQIMRQIMKTPEHQEQLSISRFLVGQFERESKPPDDKRCEAIIRGFLKDSAGKSSFTTGEISFMESLVPKQLTEAEIELLLADVLPDILRGSDGQAIGVAMKALKGQAVDGSLVKEIVIKYRKSVAAE